MDLILNKMVKFQNSHHTNCHWLIVWDTRLAIAQGLLTKNRHRMTGRIGNLLRNFQYPCFSDPARMTLTFDPQAQTCIDRRFIVFFAHMRIHIFWMEDRIWIVPTITEPF